MMAFDKHNSIKYNDLSHLYWKVYPYKILAPFRFPTTKSQTKLRPEEERILTAAMREPGNDVEYRRTITTNGFNYFFVNESDARNFIDRNAEFISDVWRPHDEKVLSILKDHKVRIRSSLFWAKFKWCVTFDKAVSATDQTMIDDWVTSHFDGDDNGAERLFYSYATPRKLYLDHDLDLLAVKVSMGEFTKSVELAVVPEKPTISEV